MNKPSKRSLLSPTLIRKALGYAALIGALAVAGYFIFILFKPLGVGASSALEMRKLERQVEAKRQEKTALEEKNAALQSPQGSIDAARSIGLTKPGEFVVSIHREGMMQTVAAAKKPSKKSTDSWGLSMVIGVSAILILLGSALIALKRRLARNRRKPGALTPRSELHRRTRVRPGVEVLD